jgi:hypothetical protein
MYQAPTSLWNQVWKTVPLKTEWGKVMFNLDDEELLKTLEEQSEKMVKAGHSNKVALAYQTMLPLCLESEALAAFIAKTEQPELLSVLPEVTTLAEAVNLGAKEYDLRPEDVRDLYDLLKPLMPA